MMQLLMPAFILAFSLGLGIAALVWRAQMLDMPGHRSLHASPTPRGGGIGILAGTGAVFLFASGQPVPLEGAAPLLAFTAAMTALGLADDLYALAGRLKLALMGLLCLMAAGWTGVPETMAVSQNTALPLPVWIALPGAALFLFVAVNAANFMDGSDGMLASALIPAGLGLAAAGLATGVLAASLAGVAVAGGLAGFLVLNRPPAQVFAGDAGSLCAGALYAGGALAMAVEGLAVALWLAPLFILPFLADVLLTLAKRAAGGRLSLEAHREHAYQRLVAAGWSHGQVALAYNALAAACVIAGLMALQGPDGAVFWVFWGAAMVLSGLYALVHRRVC